MLGVVPYDIFCDGAARGNPGPAAAAVVVKQSGKVCASWGVPLGTRTNNEAEYIAMVMALQWLVERGEPTATIHADSLLVVEQMNGRWKVKNDRIQKLHRFASDRWFKLEQVAIVHVRREKNRAADQLGNEALDANRVICDASTSASWVEQWSQRALATIEPELRLF